MKYFLLTLLALGVILFIPYSVGRLMERSFLNIGSLKADSWMSFWGGYLGAILGILGAITVTTIQIKSQTNQIVLAAKENDKLERGRIELNLKIEKNVELFKYFVDLKREVLQYEYTLNYLIDEQESVIVNLETLTQANTKELLVRIISKRVNEDERKSLEIADQEYNSNVERVKVLKNDLHQKMSQVKSLAANIFANIIFVDEDNEYHTVLNSYLNEIQHELSEVEKYILSDEMGSLDAEKITKRSNNLNKKILTLAELEIQISDLYSTFIKKLVTNIGRQ